MGAPRPVDLDQEPAFTEAGRAAEGIAAQQRTVAARLPPFDLDRHSAHRQHAFAHEPARHDHGGVDIELRQVGDPHAAAAEQYIDRSPRGNRKLHGLARQPDAHPLPVDRRVRRQTLAQLHDRPAVERLGGADGGQRTDRFRAGVVAQPRCESAGDVRRGAGIRRRVRATRTTNASAVSCTIEASWAGSSKSTPRGRDARSAALSAARAITRCTTSARV